MTTNNAVYISQVFANMSKDKIAKTFSDQRIGTVTHIKLVPNLNMPKGSPQVNKAYVYIDEWCDSKASREVQYKLFQAKVGNNFAVLRYADTKYWVLLPNNDRSMQLAVTKMPSKEAIAPIAPAVPIVQSSNTVAYSHPAKLVPVQLIKRQLGLPIRTEIKQKSMVAPFNFSGTHDIMIDGEMYEMPIPADIPDPDIFDEENCEFENSACNLVSADYAGMLEDEVAALRSYNMELQANRDAWEMAYNGLVNQYQYEQQQQQMQFQFDFQQEQQQQEQFDFQQQQHNEWLAQNGLVAEQPQFEQSEYCM